jgi:hypothetical protein
VLLFFFLLIGFELDLGVPNFRCCFLERDEIGEEKELSDPWRGETT